MNKVKEENILLYSTYVILYLNDTACNAIKEIEPYVKNKDKETQKIYGALKKRVNRYFTILEKITDEKLTYLADFFSEMDDICYAPMLDFKNELYDSYKSENVEESEFFAQVETMRCMVETAFVASQRIINVNKIKVPQVTFLNNYVLDELPKIANNFADWVYRKAPKNLVIDFNKKNGVMDKFGVLSLAMMSSKSFNEAYQKAIEYEKERNNK